MKRVYGGVSKRAKRLAGAGGGKPPWRPPRDFIPVYNDYMPYRWLGRLIRSLLINLNYNVDLVYSILVRVYPSISYNLIRYMARKKY